MTSCLKNERKTSSPFDHNEVLSLPSQQLQQSVGSEKYFGGDKTEREKFVFTEYCTKQTEEEQHEHQEYGQNINLSSSLALHRPTYIPETPYGPINCVEKFTLNSHHRSHKEKSPYASGMGFGKKQLLILPPENPPVEELYKCLKCGKTFPHRCRLTAHELMHSGEKPYICQVCEKRFWQMGHLTRHLRSHTGEKPYTCLHCGRKFSEGSTLNKHVRSHTGERPFKCTGCGKSFIRKTALVYHERIHTGEKPFECLECGKRFGRNSTLMQHKRTHTGERPYQCLECGKTFKYSSHFISHKRTHIWEKAFKC